MSEDFDKEKSYNGENEIIADSTTPVVKKEILNYYDNEFESTPCFVQNNREPLLSEESQSRLLLPSCSGLINNENSQNKLLNCNKIILGSKPNRFSIDGDNSEKTANGYEDKNAEPNRVSSDEDNSEKTEEDEDKNDVSIDENYFEELVTSYESSVVLQDIQSYLHKSRRFCNACGILFPESNGYETHVLIFHTENRTKRMSHERSLTERREHKCPICAKQFVAPHVLRRHLMNIHKLNHSNAILHTTKNTNAKLIEDTTKESNRKVIKNVKKKVATVFEKIRTDTIPPVIENTAKQANGTVFENITREANAKIINNAVKEVNSPKIYHESADLSNTCFHCKKAFDTQKSLIEHLYDILQMKRKNTEIVPVLKSVLFKCNKCDIHFTSSQLAANHAEHMEMLVNWKCTICNRIFKKEDELSHERQHSASNNFLIYNLGDLDVANILFRCSKCATHFTESNFLYHFRDCGLEETKTVTCKICNILLDQNLKTLHEFDKHTESKPFTIIQCDVISDNPVKPTVTKSQTRGKLKELIESFREVQIVLQKIDSNKINRLTKSGRIGIASQEPAKVLQDNEASGKLWHMRLRECNNTSRERKLVQGLNKNKPANIADHSVLRRRNMTYSYCRTCKCFITKFRRAVHIQGCCRALAKSARTCEHCGLILNKISMMSHRRLHMERKDLKLANFRFFNLTNGRSVDPPIPEYPKCTDCAVHFLTKIATSNHVCREVAYQTCNLCKIKLSEPAYKFHMTFHQYATNRNKIVTSSNLQAPTTLDGMKCVADEHVTDTSDNELPNNILSGAENTNREYATNDKNKLDALQVAHEKKPLSIAYHLALRKLNMTYCYCDTCKCFVTKFKKTAHVQGRCKKLGKLACTCEHCGLILTSASIVTHRRLHLENEDLKLKNFRFFDLYTGRSVKPHIPEYPKCTDCAVHFLTKIATSNHVCKDVAYQTCNLCKMKLSEPAYKFHMTFHQYATNRNKIVKSSNLQAATTLDVVKCVADDDVTDICGNENVLPDNLLSVAETKPIAIRKTRKFCHKYEVKRLNAYQALKNKKSPVNIADLRRRNFTYFYCETCKCFVTKFKKSAHVQRRCKKLAKIACTCEYCGLILNSASIVTHRRLHTEKQDLKLKNFRFFNLYTGRSTNPSIPVYPRCNHCAVHFLTENSRNDHICNAEAYQTCLVCQIKLSEAAFKLHMAFHQYATDRTDRVASKNSHSTPTLDIENSVIDENATIRTESHVEAIHDQLETTQTGNISQELKMNDETKLDESLVANKKKPVNIAQGRRNMTYSYCDTCKCFVTKFRIAAHVQGRCKKSASIACTCVHCGLILNDASIVTHKRIHEERKNIKLKNFRFFDLYTGRSMNPPIPEYPKCTHCAVHFLTKKARNNHNCSQQAYQACSMCEVKLSQAAFKLHMMFHQYATDDNNTVTTKNSKSATALDAEKRFTDENVSDNTENDIDSIHDPVDVAETEHTVKTSQEYKINDKIEQDMLPVENTKKQEFEMNDMTKLDAALVDDKIKPVYITDHFAQGRRNISYSYCETCKCFVTTFRKAAHLKGRCKKLAKITGACEHCGLILNDVSIVTHRRLHEERENLKLKDFRFFNIYTGRSMNPPIPEYPKCTRCAVQFITKTDRNNHICSEQSYQMCHLCETKLSEAAFKLHMMFHQYTTDRSNTVTTKNSQSETTLGTEKRVTDENVSNNSDNGIESIQNPADAETELIATSSECKINDKAKLDASLVENKKEPVHVADHFAKSKRNMTYSYCETCKCFVTKFRKGAHVQGRCKNFAKITGTCKDCGLILNDTSIVTHRRLHEETKNLKLKNFRFFNLYTGRLMNPPIPEYPKCSQCAVQFLTKIDRKNHICSEQSYQMCHLCEAKLSEAAFNLHMMFHEYPSDRFKGVTKMNSQSVITSDNDKLLTDENLTTTANDIEVTDNPLSVNETRLTLNSQSAVTYDIEISVTKEELSDTGIENATELISNPLDVPETLVQYSAEIYEIVYTCGNCSVSVDTYDKVVEHCQGHYEKEKQEIQAKVCVTCELTIDAACYTNHHNLHVKGKQFQLLKFDSYYLPADNSMWVKHIFKTLPNDKVLDILRRSIYRFECRIKMDVIQQGDPNLTVYKCDQCCCFIEPSSLSMHSDNSCFKLRHHPCTVCGIPFNSSASRMDHEKIHNRPGITTDSYRIVIFNREEDKQINRSFYLRKNYVLYQCRNCGVIIDKLLRDIHKCDFSNVNKCPQCALLLHSDDFEKHLSTHEELVSFNYSNMKIIILGDNSPKDRNECTLRSNFKGAIYDYKMYICNKCEICVKNELCMTIHICRFGKQRLKCLKCQLYFSVGTLKTHTRSHEKDPDFVRSNMNIVLFDPCNLDQNKNKTRICSIELSDSNTDSDIEILAANDTSIADVAQTDGKTPETLEEGTVKLYKCTCELHFLSEDSIIRHFGVCRSKATISKQKCPKCDLLFTANVLFTHLLAHHSKKSCYKYDVTEMDNTQKNMIQ